MVSTAQQPFQILEPLMIARRLRLLLFPDSTPTTARSRRCPSQYHPVRLLLVVPVPKSSVLTSLLVLLVINVVCSWQRTISVAFLQDASSFQFSSSSSSPSPFSSSCDSVVRKRSWIDTRAAETTTTTSTTTSFTARNMFTGIVEDMGTIIEFEQRDNVPMWDGSCNSSTTSTVMTIQTLSPDVIISDDTKSSYIGCSISVSGVCLTATQITTHPRERQQFTVTLAPETLRKTYFGFLSSQQLLGSRVNLERAAEMMNMGGEGGGGGRNSGHYVQGHVDDVGTILNRVQDKDSIVYTIQVKDAALMSYIVPKGFIAIDGTSLTVIDTDIVKRTFTLMLIPYTQDHIVLPMKQIGDFVNIEVDILSKYASNYNNNNNNVDTVAVAKIQEQFLALEERVQALETELATYREKM